MNRPHCKYRNEKKHSIKIERPILETRSAITDEPKDTLEAFACPRCGILFIDDWRVDPDRGSNKNTLRS